MYLRWDVYTYTSVILCLLSIAYIVIPYILGEAFIPSICNTQLYVCSIISFFFSLILVLKSRKTYINILINKDETEDNSTDMHTNYDLSRKKDVNTELPFSTESSFLNHVYWSVKVIYIIFMVLITLSFYDFNIAEINQCKFIYSYQMLGFVFISFVVSLIRTSRIETDKIKHSILV